MTRRGVIGAGGAAMLLLGGFLLYGYVQQPAGASPEFAHWSPTPTAIRSKLGTASAPTPGMTDENRHTLFCTMFKGRFRQHDPAVAVGLRFITPTHIKLMCPARMEPYFMDQIALALWRETREIFGKAPDIDIYDTFIGTTQIKIGELRTSAEDAGIAHISYDFRPLQAMNGPQTFRRVSRRAQAGGPLHAPPMVPISFGRQPAP
jgi:hypothetical protein